MLKFEYLSGQPPLVFELTDTARCFAILLPEDDDVPLVLRNFACLDYTNGIKSALDDSSLVASYLSSVSFDVPESFKRVLDTLPLCLYRLSVNGLQEALSGDLDLGDLTSSGILHVIHSFAFALEKILPDYTVRVDLEEKRVRYFYKGVEIQDYQYLNQDGFLLFCLLDKLIHMPRHAGVFFIDATGISEAVLRAVACLIGCVFGEAGYVFFYNVPAELYDYSLRSFGVQPLRLPNHWVPDTGSAVAG